MTIRPDDLFMKGGFGLHVYKMRSCSDEVVRCAVVVRVLIICFFTRARSKRRTTPSLGDALVHVYTRRFIVPCRVAFVEKIRIDEIIVRIAGVASRACEVAACDAQRGAGEVEHVGR